MAICTAVGNCKRLALRYSRGVLAFYGFLDSVHFISIGDETLPGLRGEVSISCGDSNDAKGRKSATWLSYVPDERECQYDLVLMLPPKTFLVFQRIAERHLGFDLVYGFSFEQQKFAEGRGTASLSMDELFEGKRQLVTENPEIDLSFGTTEWRN